MKPKMRQRPRRSVLLLALLLPLLAHHRVHAQDTESDGPLNPGQDIARVRMIDNDTIIRMAKSGLSDDVLIETIKTQPGRYDVRPDDLIKLKTSGVSDKVILTMQAYGNPQPKRAPGLQSRTGPPSTVNYEPRIAPDPLPLAPGVDEIGVYYKSQKGETAGQWLPLQTERVVFKSGGAAKSILTHGIISKDMNGHLEGAKSPLIVSTGVQLLIYAPLGTDGNEYDLLRFEEHKDNREFRTLTGGVFHSESGAARDEIEFHPQKIAPQMYTFTVPKDIEKGEYGVLPPGSANQQGIAGTGKIFTFSIIE